MAEDKGLGFLSSCCSLTAHKAQSCTHPTTKQNRKNKNKIAHEIQKPRANADALLWRNYVKLPTIDVNHLSLG